MSKRIGIFYDNTLGRNDGNPLYVWRSLRDDFKDKGISVVHLIPKEDMKDFGKFDLNIWVDWGEDALKEVLSYEPLFPEHPNAYWASDTHLGYEYRLETAKKFDYVFCAQKRACEEFKRDGIKNPIWLPHAVEPRAYPNNPVAIKKYDICFIGFINGDKRTDALTRMFGEFPNFNYDSGIFFDKVADEYRKSRICFNIAVKDDINMRMFEIMATGSFLLTEWLPTIEEYFKDGVHCVMYKTLDEAVEKAKYYLKHEDEREKVAKAGMEEVFAKHTIKHRVETMLKTANLI